MAQFKFYLQKPLALWKMLLLVFIVGALMALALPPYFLMPFGFLGFTTLVVLFDKLQKNTKKHLKFFLLSWVFGSGYFILGLWWIGNALVISDSVAPFFAPVSVTLLSLTLALYWGIAGLICSFFWRPNLSRFFLIAFAFGLCEFLRGTLFTGFPWNSIGYTAMPTPLLMQSAVIFTVYGVNIFAVFIYSAPAIFFSYEQKTVFITLILCLCLADIGFGFFRLKDAKEYTNHNIENNLTNTTHDKTNFVVRIIQPSIDQNVKMDVAMQEDNLNQLIDLVAMPSKNGLKPDIIVWPETSLPYLLDYDPQVRFEISDAMPGQSYSLIGTTRRTGISQEDAHYYNSIQVLNKEGAILNYSDKLHLVPFGEYLPLADFFTAIGFKAVAEISSGYDKGTVRKTVTLPNGLTYLPLICYEIIFPTEITYEGEKPSVIINVTNDAWYGDTAGPLQHFHQAQIRAVELGLPVVRAANNGVSSVIDAYGRPLSRLTYNQVGVIDEIIPLDSVSEWHKNYNLFAFFGLFLMITFGINLFMRVTCKQ